jgi:hypothetical protein
MVITIYRPIAIRSALGSKVQSFPRLGGLHHRALPFAVRGRTGLLFFRVGGDSGTKAECGRLLVGSPTPAEFSRTCFSLSGIT